ncbi:hypothetical protein C1646_662354 [Rhizophagus diaphanus]|nr:hypothetical protein C1646_662354 [Rhizophagus diaphanus] [Rhizophagus sp. MUCL 43196]
MSAIKLRKRPKMTLPKIESLKEFIDRKLSREEKSPSDNEEPKSKLMNKLVWTYDPVPYVLGYYANGPLVTEGRQIIEVCGKNIKKTYIGPDAHDRVERLVNVYNWNRMLIIFNYVDHLNYVDKEKKCNIPFPKGMSVRPKDQQELLEAITCVLRCLWDLQGDDRPSAKKALKRFKKIKKKILKEQER